MAHHTRVLASVAVLIGISALVPCQRLHAAQSLDELREAAETGDAAAQSDLGYRYWRGQGTPQNYIEAVESSISILEGDLEGAQATLDAKSE